MMIWQYARWVKPHKRNGLDQFWTLHMSELMPSPQKQLNCSAHVTGDSSLIALWNHYVRYWYTVRGPSSKSSYFHTVVVGCLVTARSSKGTHPPPLPLHTASSLIPYAVLIVHFSFTTDQWHIYFWCHQNKRHKICDTDLTELDINLFQSGIVKSWHFFVVYRYVWHNYVSDGFWLPQFIWQKPIIKFAHSWFHLYHNCAVVFHK